MLTPLRSTTPKTWLINHVLQAKNMLFHRFFSHLDNQRTHPIRKPTGVTSVVPILEATILHQMGNPCLEQCHQTYKRRGYWQDFPDFQVIPLSHASGDSLMVVPLLHLGL